MSRYFTNLDDRQIVDTPITLELVKKVKKELEENGNKDPEMAHLTEDQLYLKFIKDIANNKLSYTDTIIIAKELETFNNIYFARWYA